MKEWVIKFIEPFNITGCFFNVTIKNIRTSEIKVLKMITAEQLNFIINNVSNE